MKIFEEEIQIAIKKGKAQKMDDELEYIKFKDDFRGIKRGTVIIGLRQIVGYPHIKRIFTLEKGIEKNIKSDEIYLEEKIDGFNLRIARVNEQILAFSRGGFVDLFASEKVNEMNLEKFFDDHPNYVLCGEMIGNTPHTRGSKEHDTKTFVFDIMDELGEFVKVEEKYEILNSYGVLGVPKLGRIKKEDYKTLKKIVAKLNRRGGEGIVIRGSGGEVVKYVTLNSDLRDIGEATEKFFDMPIGFYYQRILRSAIYSQDFKLKEKQIAAKLGNAFYKGLLESVRNVKNGLSVSENFEILISNLRIWLEIKKRMHKEIKIEEISIKPEGDKFRIKFRKHYKKTNKMLHSYLNGKAIDD